MIQEKSEAKVLTRDEAEQSGPHFWINWLGVLVFGFVIFVTLAAHAQDTIRSHYISRYGDHKYEADFPHLDYVNPDAPKGGEFSTWTMGTFDSMHPYIVLGTAGIGASIQFESLMVGTADEIDTLYGLLASELEYPTDYSWVIFYMRPEARFSDGTPVTAHDVVFSHNILKEKGIPSIQTFFADTFKSVEALDDHTVKFTFFGPSETNDLVMQAASSTVFSKAWWEGRDFAEPTLDVPVGSGEYILDEMDVGRTITYRLRDDYWGKDLPINVGQSNFETLRYEYYADTTAAFEGFKAGEYTFRSENNSRQWAQDYNFPAFENEWVEKAELPDGNIGSAQGFIFNLQKSPIDDPLVREAIGLMFNFEWSNKTLFFGLYKRVDSFFENSNLEAKGMIPDDERAILEPLAEYFPESLFTEPAVSPPVSGENQIDRAQLRAAGALLDEAGWTVGDDGIRRNADGEVLAVDILNYSPSFDRVINPFVENLKRVGIDATHTRVDTTTYIERRDEDDFDMLIYTYGNSFSPGLGLMQWFGSENADVPSRNMAGLKNEGIDALIDLVIAAENRDELELRARALDRALRSLHMWVPQWYKDVHTVAFYNYLRHPDELPPYSMGAPNWWWADQAAYEALDEAGAF